MSSCEIVWSSEHFRDYINKSSDTVLQFCIVERIHQTCALSSFLLPFPLQTCTSSSGLWAIRLRNYPSNIPEKKKSSLSIVQFYIELHRIYLYIIVQLYIYIYIYMLHIHTTQVSQSTLVFRNLPRFSPQTKYLSHFFPWASLTRSTSMGSPPLDSWRWGSIPTICVTPNIISKKRLWYLIPSKNVTKKKTVSVVPPSFLYDPYIHFLDCKWNGAMVLEDFFPYQLWMRLAQHASHSHFIRSWPSAMSPCIGIA